MQACPPGRVCFASTSAAIQKRALPPALRLECLSLSFLSSHTFLPRHLAPHPLSHCEPAPSSRLESAAALSSATIVVRKPPLRQPPPPPSQPPPSSWAKKLPRPRWWPRPITSRHTVSLRPPRAPPSLTAGLGPQQQVKDETRHAGKFRRLTQRLFLLLLQTPRRGCLRVRGIPSLDVVRQGSRAIAIFRAGYTPYSQIRSRAGQLDEGKNATG